MNIDSKIKFEILEQTDCEVIIKRVLYKKTKIKNRHKEESSLPKLSVHYFTDNDVRHLQEIAEKMSEKLMKQNNNSLSIKECLLSLFLKNKE